jgi:arylsulfatase A-like enzyme
MTRTILPAALAASLAIAAPAGAAPTNVLVMFADDLGQRDLVCYHPESFYETPNLDRLAAGGVRFTDGYSANPVCSPTRYALATGKWPTRAGLTNYLAGVRVEKFRPAPLTRELPAAETTLAEALRPAGYHNTYVGKWHLGENETDWPEHHGYHDNIGGFRAGHPKSWFSPYQNPRLKDGPEGEYLTDRLADETIKALKAAKASGNPFFISHSFYQVHTPLRAPQELVGKYTAKAARLGIQDRFGLEQQHFISDKGPRRVREVQGLPVYAAMMEAMDRAAGRILAALDELGLAENTLVVFTSDNGGLSTSEGHPTSNLPFRGGKGWVYEGGIRVPFIVRWPGVAPAGKVEPTPVSTIDIFPTALAAAGGKPAGVDGKDLAPLLRGEAFPARDLFWHYPHYGNQGGFPGGAIRSGNWKLVENYEDGRTSLYDLADDPGERKDLADDQKERVAEMKAKLHAWYRETGAKFLGAKKDGPEPWRP